MVLLVAALVICAFCVVVSAWADDNVEYDIWAADAAEYPELEEDRS